MRAICPAHRFFLIWTKEYKVRGFSLKVVPSLHFLSSVQRSPSAFCKSKDCDSVGYNTCSHVGGYQRFGDTSCLHLQDIKWRLLRWFLQNPYTTLHVVTTQKIAISILNLSSSLGLSSRFTELGILQTARLIDYWVTNSVLSMHNLSTMEQWDGNEWRIGMNVQVSRRRRFGQVSKPEPGEHLFIKSGLKLCSAVKECLRKHKNVWILCLLYLSLFKYDISSVNYGVDNKEEDSFQLLTQGGRGRKWPYSALNRI